MMMIPLLDGLVQGQESWKQECDAACVALLSTEYTYPKYEASLK
jgi:hypothetical protein